jgi:hypothetical protein
MSSECFASIGSTAFLSTRPGLSGSCRASFSYRAPGRTSESIDSNDFGLPALYRAMVSSTLAHASGEVSDRPKSTRESTLMMLSSICGKLLSGPAESTDSTDRIVRRFFTVRRRSRYPMTSRLAESSRSASSMTTVTGSSCCSLAGASSFSATSKGVRSSLGRVMSERRFESRASSMAARNAESPEYFQSCSIGLARMMAEGTHVSSAAAVRRVDRPAPVGPVTTMVLGPSPLDTCISSLSSCSRKIWGIDGTRFSESPHLMRTVIRCCRQRRPPSSDGRSLASVGAMGEGWVIGETAVGRVVRHPF